MPLTLKFTQSGAPIPLIPPPPTPLNIPPSRARRQLAARLALHKQQAEELAACNSDDPFASLGDRDDEGDASDPFTLDEEEEDITASGRRDKKPRAVAESSQGFSMSRGLTSLFATSSRGRGNTTDEGVEGFTGAASPPEEDENNQNSSGSDDGERHHPLESTLSQERIPLETDDDEDEEMGEMVAPSEDADEDVDDEEHSNSSEDQDQGEMLSPVEREKLRGSFGSTGSAGVSKTTDLGRQDQQQERDEDEEEDEEGEGLVEIAMPTSGGRRMT